MTAQASQKKIDDNCVELFPWAVKLRNKTLFREIMVFLVCPWFSPRYRILEDGKLQRVAQHIYNGIAGKIAAVEELLLEMRTNETRNKTEKGTDSIKNIIQKVYKEIDDGDYTAYLPTYYREFYTQAPSRISNILEDLLSNNSLFQRVAVCWIW